MAYVLSPDKKRAVLHLLIEGNSIRSTERLTGVHRDTVMRLLVKTGEQCRNLLDREMRGLTLRHVQADEIWTYVGCKTARVPVDERRHSPKIGEQYLFVAFDQDTKLVPCYALGKRTGDLTRRFMMDLASRLKRPNPHASDAHAFAAARYQPITQISTDAFAPYPESVDQAFGPYVKYGQLVKDYRNREMPGRYAPAEMVGADRRTIFGDFDKQSICTSHVERNNATIRLFLKRFNRLTLCFSKKWENLAAAIALHVTHYNFCRRHGSLRATPAMAAGVTNTLWSLETLIERSQS